MAKAIAKTESLTDFADRVRNKKAYRHTLPMCMDSMLTNARAVLTPKLTDAETTVRAYKKLPADHEHKIEAEQLLDDLQVEAAELDVKIEAESVPFVFQSLPRKVYQDLNRLHGPTDEEKAEFAQKARDAGKPVSEQKGPRISAISYPPVIVHRCLISPSFEADEIYEWFHGDESPWNGAELQMLLNGAEMACNGISVPS